MNKIPTISVIITTYNRADLLPRAIDSVLNQTYKDFELIIVDDGSTDNTREIVENFKQKDSRMVYIYQENQGLPSALNKGLSVVRGEFIAFLDSDDEWLPLKLEKQYLILKENNKYSGVTCYGNIIYESGSKKYYVSLLKQKNGATINDLLLGKFPAIPSSLLIKKEVINKTGYYDEFFKLSTDADMMIRIFKNNFKIYVIEEPLFNYFIHQKNLTGITAESKTLSIRQRIKEAERLILKHQDVYNKIKPAKSLMLRYLSTYYKLDKQTKKSFEYLIKAFFTFPSPRLLLNLFLLLLPLKIYTFLFDLKVNMPIFIAVFRHKIVETKG